MKLFGNERTQRVLVRELAKDPYMLRKIPSDSIQFFIDIGAQAGLVSVMFRLMNAHTHIFAVEPDPEAYAMLAENTANLHVATIRKAIGDGSSFCLTPPEKKHTLGVEYNKAEGTGTNMVESSRLTDLIAEMNKLSLVNIIPGEAMFKIDCEGGEAYIMNHAESVAILKQAKVIAFEIHVGIFTLAQYYEMFDLTFKDTHNILKVKQNAERSANVMLIRKDVTLG